MSEIPLVGTKIRGWRLARLLGVGPVSAAYEVYSTEGDDGTARHSQEHAVLKLCTIEDKEAQSLFLRAVYAANRFRHPRVVPITQDGTDEHGAPFVIRPWLEARSLAEAVTERDLTEKEVLRIGGQLLDALEMAHAHGITHGALTPHNVLVTAQGSIRLCDFAMAPSSGRESSADVRDRLAELRTGPFTPPERRMFPPAPATQQGDIWSVAACMYFALRKEPPKGEIVKPPDGISEAAKAILSHALKGQPRERYESAYAMLGDVRRTLLGRPPKLALAEKPIPSGGYHTMTVMTPPSGHPAHVLARLQQPSLPGTAPRNQWVGNLALILAIVTLVGVATFVMVREKMNDGPTQEAPAEK